MIRRSHTEILHGEGVHHRLARLRRRGIEADGRDSQIGSRRSVLLGAGNVNAARTGDVVGLVRLDDLAADVGLQEQEIVACRQIDRQLDREILHLDVLADRQVRSR